MLECSLRGHYSGYLCVYIHTLLQCLCMYIHMYSYLESFLCSVLRMCNWLACIALPRFNIDTTRRAIFLKSAGYSVSQSKKQWTTTKSINTIFSYLPTNWLDKHEEVNGDIIDNKGAIPYTKFILHTKLQAWDTTHNCTQVTFQYDNWFKDRLEYAFIVYVLLLLSFI